MGRVYLKYSKEFRESALRRLSLAPNVAQLCRELCVSRQLLYQWRETEQREQQKQLAGTEQRLRQENVQLKKAHEVIYRSWTRRRGRRPKASGEPDSNGSPTHPIHESPVGYSLTGWSPPEPISASPTETQSHALPSK